MSELRAAGVSFDTAEDLSTAIEKGMNGIKEKKAGKGALLFSPAFASFGMFKNEYDRNDLFLRLISELLELHFAEEKPNS